MKRDHYTKRSWLSFMNDLHNGDMRHLNPCGDCTFCCTAPAIPEMGKAAGETCRHCARGCSIYESRPPLCQTFECFWTLGLWRMRPDRAGICWTVAVLKGLDGNPVMIVHGFALHPRIVRDKRIQAAIRAFLKAGWRGITLNTPTELIDIDVTKEGIIRSFRTKVDASEPLKNGRLAGSTVLGPISGHFDARNPSHVRKFC